jgi:asparagine synthetase B (glutamine-hydrolysing)
MCGIAGIYQMNGQKVPIDLVESIGRLITHRGPEFARFIGCRQSAFSE